MTEISCHHIATILRQSDLIEYAVITVRKYLAAFRTIEMEASLHKVDKCLDALVAKVELVTV